ncbi:DUF2851 family protein [Sinomicrobium soli]|uniref:DUF2851 family protein n=1 Tax=Sinomicrobium sp. N-1-3-6 TaxID=2219864 RepID=UPI0011BDAEFC|nr:DUF2851 family protein [Sinomicrobium sp. N-1-3-6]
MKEELLHYIWRFRKWGARSLVTTAGDEVEVLNTGQYNRDSGPDFFDARLRIGGQLWAGNVEIHLKSSDWYAHHHERDQAYDNVILHVVWKDDMPVFYSDNTPVPAVVLKGVIPGILGRRYNDLQAADYHFIRCEREMTGAVSLLDRDFTDRLYCERLQQKSERIAGRLSRLRNDWEAVFFESLMGSFGLSVNGDAFRSVAGSVGFTVIRKVQENRIALEALLFGQAGLLHTGEVRDSYEKELVQEYLYLRHKFRLHNENVAIPRFHRLRPPNFPTLRLSQIAHLYHRRKSLFTAVVEAKDLAELYDMFDGEASEYWDTHYVFGKTSRFLKKRVSQQFVSLLLLNTVIPVRYCYHCHRGEEGADGAMAMTRQMEAETNRVVSGYAALGVTAANAAESQALLRLYHAYCEPGRCLDCAVGRQLLSGAGNREV